MAKDYVVNLKNPEDSPEKIAEKLNTLTYAIDHTVIRGLVPRKDFEDFKDKTTKYINGNKERIDTNDLRWHGGGLSKVTHDATLTGEGTIASPLSVLSAGGGVTSVNASGGTTGLTFSGGPITTSGTLTLGGILGIANGGTGSSTAPYVNDATDTTLTRSGTGPYTLGLNLAHANSWTALQTFTASASGVSTILVKGNPSFNSGNGDFSIQSASGNSQWNVAALSSPSFALFDAVNGLLPFVIETGAPSSSIYVKSSGNVGIGTATPSERLHVKLNQDSATKILVENADGGGSSQAYFKSSNGTYQTQVGINSMGSSPANQAFFYTDTPGGFVIYDNNASGYVSIAPSGLTENARFNGTGLHLGTTAGLSRLSVNGGTAIGTYADSVVAPSNGLIVSGKVGIGASSPTAILHLAAGTATANTASLKIPSGTVLTSPEVGAVEADNTNLYWTDSSSNRLPLTTGYALSMISGTSNPVDATTNYFTDSSVTSSSATLLRLPIPKSGTIKAIYAEVSVAGTLGSSETGTLAIRINNTTDVNITTGYKADATNQAYNATSLTQTVSAGDYINVKIVNPTWATNPTTVKYSVSVYIE